ncbi:hypothetical protein HNY73_001961 [Argiope bruennichi]|uniref:Gustatory receptor n=1 Tax=Argiope bruennichi TaxID=94029 RepID=A0A8T0FTG6_ARGBR|nr:hypothetical protein HNY73_001961 [Argiope bruennichi]
MHAVESILFFVGLDVRRKKNASSFKSKLAYAYQKFIVPWFIAFTMRVITKLLSFHVVDIFNYKDRLIRKSFDVIVIVIWCVMMKRRKKISLLMHYMEHLTQNFNGKIKSSWITFATITIIAHYLIGSLTVILPFREKFCERILGSDIVGLISVPAGQSCKIWYILGPIEFMPQHIFSNVICIFYIIVCLFFRDLLITYSKVEFKKEQVDFIDFKDYLTAYERIVLGLQKFENVMSLPISIIVMNDCVGMLFGFKSLDPFKKYSGTEWRRALVWVNSFTSLRALISLLYVILTATSVATASKCAKNSQQVILKRVHASTVQEKTELLLFIKMHESPPLVLSAGDFFYFTRGLALTAIGSVLTYSLLIFQLI